jgi:acyl-homoserine-lactone acylase
VPHIFAPTGTEVAYGLAWAHAEDDFETLQLVVLSGKAKLGTAIGRKGAEADYVIDLLRIRKTVEEQWNTLSSKTTNQAHDTRERRDITDSRKNLSPRVMIW